MVQAGTTLVTLMATDVWTGAKDVVVAWWRKHHPEQADQVDTDLEQLHTRVVAADDPTRTAWTGAWQVRLQELLDTDPALTAQLQRLLDDQLTPLLATTTQTTTVTQTAIVTGDHSTVNQAGRDNIITPPPGPA